MAPTTRSGSKRASGEAVDTKVTKKAKQSVKTAAKPAKSEQPATKTPQYFRFLDLSPELRNRVYDYANEDDSRNYALRPRPILPNSPRKSHSERPWKFFALTQVCTQIRAEYCPLWIQHLRVRFATVSEWTHFGNAFLHNEGVDKLVPGLVQFSWDHRNDGRSTFDMMPLLHLYVQSTSSKVAFVPHMLATSGYTVEDDMCHNCYRNYEMEELGYSSYGDDDCECPDYDWCRSEWRTFKNKQMRYTRTMQKFIHNSNESWAQAVREDKLTVTCTVNKTGCHVTFKILYKEPICQTTTDSKPALDLLEQWGIFDLPVKRCTDFVLVYEDKQVTEKDGRKGKITNSVVRKVHVHKDPPKDEHEPIA